MKSTALVINTDALTKPHMHWIDIDVNHSEEGMYSDSYRDAPFVPDQIDRLRKNFKNFCWNRIQLQSALSEVCGQFCVMFSHYITSGLSFENFISIFSADLVKNDSIDR